MTRIKITLMALFALSGLILSSYLSLHHYEIRYGENYKSACNFNAKLNCDAVALHPTAEILGIPVAALGDVFYLMVFFFLLNAWKNNGRLSERMESYFIAILLTGVVLDIYFLWVSIKLIHTLCPFCAGSYAANLLLLVFSLDYGKSWKKALSSLKTVFSDLGWGLQKT